MNKEGKEILGAVIGGIALIISALITGFFSSAPTRMAIQATQTAEANLSSLILPTPTYQILSTPTLQATNILPTPISTIPAQESPLSSIPFRKNELLLAITGVILIIAYSGTFLYLSSKIPYKYNTTILRILVAVAIIAPFVLVWTSFFFSFPQDIPFALVLFVALFDFALLFWFPDFFTEKLQMLWSILILISPVYITAFGFTNMTISEAFITASVIIGVEVLYFAGLLILDRIFQKA
jgi:prepilin signal peptidase PulO-like enzyme (type II secretory pathway)